MKKKLLLVLSFVLCICMVLSGCGNNLKMPSGDISSNGGRVVSVGDYVYYANTYVDYTTLTSGDNKEGKTEHNSLLRIKTNSYGGINISEDGTLNDVETVMEKIAGFNKSSMFAIKDYLFFTSPNVHKDKSGNDRFDLTTLFRIKLDGTGLKEILTTKSSQGEFFLVTSNNPYLLIYDNEQISKIAVGEKIGKLETLVSDVKSVVFPKTYSNISTLYYTTDVSENDQNSGITGNYLNKLNLQNGSHEVVEGKQVSQTITLVAYENNVLYYKRAEADTELYYSNTMTGSFEAGEIARTIMGGDDITYFTPINADKVCYMYDSSLYVGTEKLVSDITRIDAVCGDYIYYTTESGMSRISYRDKVSQVITTQTKIEEGTVEFAGEYVYYYAKIEETEFETKYLYRVSVRNVGLGETANYECLSLVVNEETSEEE